MQRVGSVEMMNTECNRPLLEQIAQITGGQVIPPTAIGEVLQLVSFTPEVSETIRALAAMEPMVKPAARVGLPVHRVDGAEREGAGMNCLSLANTEEARS